MNMRIILEGIDKAQRVLSEYITPKASSAPDILYWQNKAEERGRVLNELLGILDHKDFVRAVNTETAIMQGFQDDGRPRPQVPGPAPFIAEPIRAQPASVCGATDAVMRELVKRSAVGLKKYGVSVGDRKDLTLSQWLKHLQEELLDGAVYIEKVRAEENSDELDRLRQENTALREQVAQLNRDVTKLGVAQNNLTTKINSLKLVLNS